MLTQQQLLRLVDTAAVEAAIARAEARTSGEIKVSLAPYFWGSVRRTAERAFVRLGVDATRERNGVLIFVVPARRCFVVLGDRGVAERVGPGLWQEVCARLGAAFHEGRYTAGLVAAIELLGDRLAEHFPVDPARPGDQVPNRVDVGMAPH